MVSQTLKENDTALSALYPYWRMRIDIFHVRIVVLVAMPFLCFHNKLRRRFPMVIHRIYHSSFAATCRLFKKPLRLLTIVSKVSLHKGVPFLK